MKYLVTGAAGFIGSSLCEALLQGGHDVVGLDGFTPYYHRAIKETNLEIALNYDRFTLLEAELASVDLATALDGTEAVFHLAAQPGVRASWGEGFDIYVHHNLLATQALLDACRRHPPRRLVYASSSSIYGEAVEGPVSEDAVPRPVSPYGVTKLAAEHLCNVYGRQFDLSAVSLRYFTVFGPKQRPDMAFNRFIHSALLGAPIAVYGDGHQSRDFTFIADVVAATIAAAASGPRQATYNIGGGARWTIRQVLTVIESLVNRPLDVRYESAAPGDVRDTSADTQRARDVLGYAPAIGVEEGLQREIRWMEGVLSGHPSADDGSAVT